MDLLKQLVELNNSIELHKFSETIYTIDSDDEEEDIELIQSLREKFVNDYLKVNNRQFKLVRNTVKKE